jgi:large subunit ribosomal protein L14
MVRKRKQRGLERRKEKSRKDEFSISVCMIQLRSVLKPADNSGAKKLKVIGVPARAGKTATIGHVVNCIVDGADPNGAVSDREKVKVLIVRTKKEIGRKDGTYLRFDDNAGVIIDKSGLPKGTRILGPIAREIKEIGYTKISSLAREVV